MSTPPGIPAPAGAPGAPDTPQMPPPGVGFPPPGMTPPAGVPGMPMPQDVMNVVRGLFGVMTAHTFGAAVRLRIIETIDEGNHSVAEIASSCGTDPGATHRLLRAMTSLDLLTETEDGGFRVAPAGTLLHGGRPGSMASLVKGFTDPTRVRAWEGLAEAVRTGETAFPKYFGQSFFDYLKDRPDVSAEFNESMSEMTQLAAAAIPQHFDFGRYGTVVDVGGGNGTLLAGVLRAYPQIKGILLDTPHGLAESGAVMREAGLEDRFTAVPGDFLAEVPEGGQLYVLKAVLHDWHDEQCITILRNIRNVIPEDGKLLIIEGVLPTRVNPELRGAYLIDLNMLVMHGGLERTTDEFRVLLEKSGFAAPTFTTLPLPGEITFIETTPVAH